MKPFSQHGGNFMGGDDSKASMLLSGHQGGAATMGPPWEGRSIATHKLRLVEFSAFVEAQREPDSVS